MRRMLLVTATLALALAIAAGADAQVIQRRSKPYPLLTERGQGRTVLLTAYAVRVKNPFVHRWVRWGCLRLTTTKPQNAFTQEFCQVGSKSMQYVMPGLTLGLAYDGATGGTLVLGFPDSGTQSVTLTLDDGSTVRPRFRALPPYFHLGLLSRALVVDVPQGRSVEEVRAFGPDGQFLGGSIIGAPPPNFLGS
jgi:hypothetical protein